MRIAIDIVRKAHKKEYDVALVFSQDQDLSEAATLYLNVFIEKMYPASPGIFIRKG